MRCDQNANYAGYALNALLLYQAASCQIWKRFPYTEPVIYSPTDQTLTSVSVLNLDNAKKKVIRVFSAYGCRISYVAGKESLQKEKATCE